MWSIGCIMAEFILRKPLFNGHDTNHQLQKILDFIGTPAEEDSKMGEGNAAFEDIIEIFNPPKDFNKVFSNINNEAIDLLKKLLVFNPEKRYTA